MKRIMSSAVLVVAVIMTACAQKSNSSILEVSKQFVKAADIQDGKMLAEVLEENSLQYVYMGGKLSTFGAKDYIKLVSEKQLGGVPREVSIKHQEQYGDHVAVVVLNAVSHEYNFLYQLTLSKSESNEWIIVGIMTEIKAA